MATFAFAMLVPIAAAAQTADPSPADGQPAGGGQVPSQGPMIIEQIHNGFLGAPEAKATEFDKKAFGLVGGSAGWVFDEALFVGGGGYWMVPHSDRELAYGGVVLQWFVHNGDRFGWSAKVLAGGGEARLPVTVTQILYPPVPDPRIYPPQPIPPVPPRTVTTTIRAHEGFVVAEPEVNARIHLAKHVRLAIGAGYRFTGSDRRFRDGFDGDGISGSRLNGATGTLSVQIGG
jgi:hypothetical protein